MPEGRGAIHRGNYTGIHTAIANVGTVSHPSGESKARPLLEYGGVLLKQKGKVKSLKFIRNSIKDKPWAANLATSARQSSVSTSLIPSVSSSASYCLDNAFFGSLRILMKSSTLSDFSSTRMGNLPCSSGIMSLGLDTWNAPAAMNRMWSVRTKP